MPVEDVPLQQYWSLDPRRFSLLEGLTLVNEWSTDSEHPPLTMLLELRSHLPECFGTRLLLRCEQVSGLEFRPTGPSPVALVLLEIRNVRDLQWEGRAYRICETENDTLSFWCQHFEAQLVETSGGGA